MPRPGGESDKLGNRYEAIWTITKLLDLAAGESVSLIVEPFGPDALGIEFIADRHDGGRDFHSVKRQHSKEWSLAELTRAADTGRSVLADLFEKLSADDQATCWFVSATGANDLRELAERASHRKALADFQHDVLHEAAEPLRRSFERIHSWRYWELAGGPRSSSTPTGRAHRRGDAKGQVEQRIASLVYRPDGGNFLPSDIRLVLGEFITGRLGSKILREDVWSCLGSHGYGHRDWATDKTVRDTTSENNRAYVRAVELELVNGGRIARAEVQVVVEELTRTDGPKVVLVSAPAGVGKSCAIAQVVDGLDVRWDSRSCRTNGPARRRSFDR